MPEAGAALRRHYNRNKKNSTYEFIVCMIKSETSDQLLGLHCSKDGKATHTVLKMQRSGIDTIKYHTSPETPYHARIQKVCQRGSNERREGPNTTISRPSSASQRNAIEWRFAGVPMMAQH